MSSIKDSLPEIFKDINTSIYQFQFIKSDNKYFHFVTKPVVLMHR